MVEVVGSKKAVHKTDRSSKVGRINKKRKSATGDRAGIEETVQVLDDKVKPRRLKVTFLEPLVNPFEGGILGCQDKLDELSNYFTGPDDKVAINNAYQEELGSVFLMFFRRVVDVSTLIFLYF